MNPSLKRLIKDEIEVQDEVYNKLFSVRPKVATVPTSTGSTTQEKNMYSWEGVIYGPADSPYEGGTFYVAIDIPEDYPLKPPLFKLCTRIYHPNIKTDGQICLDILKRQWSPALGISRALLSIIVLLSEPNARDPLNAAAGNQYLANKDDFEMMARAWTAEYAMGL
jgi:ubiquitin-conjugating enzyme E2 D